MVPYIILLLFAAGTGLILCQWKGTRKRELIFWVVMTLAMAAMAGLRNPAVGVDTAPYVGYFQQVCENDFSFLFSPANGYRKEIGYSLFNYLLSLFTEDVTAFLTITSGAIILLRMIAVWRQSSSVWISVFVYISFGFFGYSMCTLRQELAISIAFFALPYLRDRKPVPYLLICALAATFHMSLWILLPLYFLAHLPLDWRAYAVYGGGTLLILMFSEWFLNFVTQFAFKSYKPGTYYTMGRDFNTALMILVFAVVFLLAKRRILERDPRNIAYLNWYFYASLLFILTMKHFAFQRVGLIFLPVILFLLPELLNALRPDAEKYALLDAPADKHQKKAQAAKLAELRAQRKSENELYYSAMALSMIGCALYYLFLLSANRLLLVPYLSIFQ